jgi:flap endonuclease-1
LKHDTVEARRETRNKAQIRYEQARQVGDFASARKYAQASSRLDEHIIDTSKTLLKRLGIPVVESPTDGEAQSSHMTKTGVVYAAASQDYDSLLFGATRLVRNLTMAGRRKLPNRDIYREVRLEIIELENFLSQNMITAEQLVILGMLVGTDFMPGIKGVGPKTAMKLVRSGLSIEEIYSAYNEKKPDVFDEVFGIFSRPDVIDVMELSWGYVNEQAVMSFLVDENDFSEERIAKALIPVLKIQQSRKGSNILSKWMS